MVPLTHGGFSVKHQVDKRIPPRLHRMLKCWMADPHHHHQEGGRETGVKAGVGEKGHSLLHLFTWEGLLEAVGGDGEEAFVAEDLQLHRQEIFQMWLAWILFLEHVDGVAQSAELRDVYSTYVSLLGVVPILMQVCHL